MCVKMGCLPPTVWKDVDVTGERSFAKLIRSAHVSTGKRMDRAKESVTGTVDGSGHAFLTTTIVSNVFACTGRRMDNAMTISVTAGRMRFVSRRVVRNQQHNGYFNIEP